MVLEMAGQVLTEDSELEIIDWRTIPPFDSDVLVDGYPVSVAALRERIRQSDGLLIVTPEYNFSIPGMLKNLLDWLSRGPEQPLAGKPVAVISASPGILGGARVQYELRRVLQCLDAQVMNKPEVFIGSVHEKFSADGHCTDLPTRDFLQAQMQAFTYWIKARKNAI